MARFHGQVGFLYNEQEDYEHHPGVWTEKFHERNYYGDVFSHSARWDQNGNSINDNLVVNHRISIVADTYANQHLGAMRYVRWKGFAWKITNVEIQYPRITLTIGGEYHVPENSVAPHS